MFLHIILYICVNYEQLHIMKYLAEFIKEKRKEEKLTQEEFADRAGVALTVIRKIEQGKENLNLSSINQVLKMFGYILAPIEANHVSKNDMR